MPENHGDGFGREFWQTELVSAFGSYWWAGENWVTRKRASEMGFRVVRDSDRNQQSLADLEAQEGIAIKRGSPVSDGQDEKA